MNEEARRNQLAENMRFYGDMRFKQLTLLIGAMTLVGAGVAQYPNVPVVATLDARSLLAMAGMLFAGVMWLMEVRSTVNFVAAREQAPDLWPFWSPERFGWLNEVLNATNAVLVLHVIFYWFWFWCAAMWQESWALLTAGSIGGGLLLAFSGVNYFQVWRHEPARKSGAPPA